MYYFNKLLTYILKIVSDLNMFKPLTDHICLIERLFIYKLKFSSIEYLIICTIHFEKLLKKVYKIFVYSFYYGTY